MRGANGSHEPAIGGGRAWRLTLLEIGVRKRSNPETKRKERYKEMKRGGRPFNNKPLQKGEWKEGKQKEEPINLT